MEPLTITPADNLVTPTNILLEIEAWANAEFPRFFRPLYNMKNPLHVQMHRYRGLERDGRVIEQALSIYAAPVGEIAGAKVLAHLRQDDKIELYTETNSAQGQTAEGLMAPLKDFENVYFYVPFSYPLLTMSPTSIERLECIIRWYFLVAGFPHAVLSCQGHFKMHFRDACRDVARAVGAVAPDDELGLDNTRLGKQYKLYNSEVHTDSAFRSLQPARPHCRHRRH